MNDIDECCVIFLSFHKVEIYYTLIVFYLSHTHICVYVHVCIYTHTHVLNVYIGSDEENFIIQETRNDGNSENSNIRRVIKSINAMDFTCSTH